MPITKMMNDDSSFTEKDIAILVLVFESTLQKLGLDRGHPAALSIAKELIAALRDGKRDPEILSASALAMAQPAAVAPGQP